MNSQFSITNWKKEHLPNLLVENDFKSAQTPEIFNNGKDRFIIVFDKNSGHIAIVNDFNGKDWDVIWESEDLRPQLERSTTVNK